MLGPEGKTKHGAYPLPGGGFEFWWFGAQMSPEAFNEQCYRSASQISDECEAMAHGMDMGSLLLEGKTKLEMTEKILALPICPGCKALITERYYSW